MIKNEGIEVNEINNWLHALLSRFEDKEQEPEPFSIKKVKKGTLKLYYMLTPWIISFQKLNSIYDWHNKLVTACLATLYFIIWYHDLLLPLFMGWIIVSILLIRVDMILGMASENPKSRMNLPWKTWMVEQVPFDYQVFIEKQGPFIQKLLLDVVNYLERFKNLLSWKNPTRTTILVVLMTLSTMTPIRLIVKMTLFYIGIEFFVLHALRCHYPRYKRMFNVLEWLLLDIPCDDDQENKRTMSAVPRSVIKTEPLTMTTTKKTTTTAVTTTSENDLKSKMVFLASANFTHKLLHSDDKKKKKKQQEVKSKAVVEKLLKSDDPNVFGCVYKEQTGFIRLEGNGFIFMSQQKRLVAVAWKDIVNVIKSNKKGISISIKDGVILTFDPVINRDECFHSLVKNYKL